MSDAICKFCKTPIDLTILPDMPCECDGAMVVAQEKEIERLRVQVGDLIDAAADSDPEGRVWMLVPLVEWVEKDNRIEELEKAEKHWAFKHGVCKGMHHITTDQIRAAWRHANTHIKTESRLVEFALNELGIVRDGDDWRME